MISLNFANMMEDVIGPGGLSKGRIDALTGRISEAHEAILNRKRPGLAFIDLKEHDTSEIKNIARQVKETSESFLILGIGGSALGPKTILEALSPLHNLRKSPRVFIYDNVDPMTLKGLLSVLDLDKTTVNVITKSGSTAETAASFMVLIDMMKGRTERFIATTDPVKGNLRKLVSDTGMRSLPIPPDVGGRFSVLSPVGLLMTEVIGADSDELLRGAKDIHGHCSSSDVYKNPAYLFGALLYLMDTEKNRPIDVMLPYSDRLMPLAEWFCQLWAESLGKKGMGPTPYPSVGTTDQHSQLQLWMEGPHDKVITFLKIADHGADVNIPDVFKDTEIGYLGGHGFVELINAEEESTELCLAKAGRPNMTIHVPKIDAYHLGQLFHLFELSTAFTGFLYGINPFDQPSVEEGKNYTYGMMGRSGYEAKKSEVEEARKNKTRWII